MPADGAAVRQGVVLAQDERDLVAGQEPVRVAHHPGARAGQACAHPVLQGRRVPDQVEPRAAAEAGRLDELARESDEGLPRQGHVPDGLRACDGHDSDGLDADYDRLN